ncbi:hypothetical protein [Bacillus salipaludis]|uniref:Uncharacterized protein n=1 Tax=Bacillus salipaludis TaxID=2547811 RepID=A0AA90QU72_9BACI|nr:hypothetical protein [Bacillus salipaludis]MDQ6598337.1 hypothetical protein [Bacillus salipaludis]
MDHVEVPEVREVMVLAVVPEVPEVKEVMALVVVPEVPEVKEVMALAVVPEVLEVKEVMALAVVPEVQAAGAVAGQVDEKTQAEKKAVQMEIMVLKVSAASIPV